jgi:ADP-ribosylation factor family
MPPGWADQHQAVLAVLLQRHAGVSELPTSPAHWPVYLHCPTVRTGAPLRLQCTRSKHQSLSASKQRPWSRCGQASSHALQAIIYVVDSTDRDRIGISREEFHSLLSEDELAEALILVYANKQASFRV